MAGLSDNYPAMDSHSCFSIGIGGGCGPDCPVYLDGDCSEAGEMIPRLENMEQLAEYEELYGQVDFADAVAIANKEK